MGNYSKFATGYNRIMSMSTPEVFLSGYKKARTGDLTMVAYNDTAFPQTVNIDLRNCVIKGSLTPYRTSETENLEKLDNISVGGSRLTVLLAPLSTTTFVGKAASTSPNADVNLAAYKPVYASSNERWMTSNHLLNPSVVFIADDYEFFSWISDASADDGNNPNNQWAYIDLLKERQINRIRVKWGSDAAKSYSVQVSKNTNNWKTMETVSNGERWGELDKNVDEVARYVRVYATARINSKVGYNLRNLQIFGSKNEIQ